MSDKFQLIKIPNPFNRHEREVQTFESDKKLSLFEIRQKYCPSDINFAVSLNGQLVAKENLALTFPRNGDQILLIPELEGGGGSGKNILKIIAGIILIVAGIILTAYGFPIGPYVTSAGIGMLIGGVVGLLFPAKKPNIPSLGDDYENSQMYSWDPSTIQQQGVVIPRYYGKNKLYGNIITANLESNGDKQYLNSLLALGMGPMNRLYDFRVNEQPIENYQGVDVYARLGDLNQEVIPNFNDTKIEYPTSVKIVKPTPYVYATVGDEFDGLEVEVVCPNGLWFANDNGGINAIGVNVKVEMRKLGDPGWTTITSQVLTSQVTVLTPRWSAGRWLDDDGDAVWQEYEAGSSDPYAHVDGERYSEDEGWIWRWWELTTLKTVETTVDYATITGAQTSNIRRCFKIPNLQRGNKYEIKVSNLSDDQTSSRYGDDLYLSSVREVLYDDFEYPRIALAGLRALATDQLSGSLRFSCMSEGLLVRVHDSSNWTTAYSTNPAWVMWDVLTRPVFDNDLNIIRYDGIDLSENDLIKFKELADFCDELVPDGKGGTEKRVTYNGGFDSETNVWEALMQVGKLGRGLVYPCGMKYTVAIDKAEEPVQMFTVGNIGIDSFKESFLGMSERASEIEVEFLNEENDYKRDRVTVINPDVGTTNKTSVQAFGVTKPSEAWRYARRLLANNQYVKRVIEIETDIDSLACSLGDAILIQHDVPGWGAAGGRVVSATLNTVTLDKEVTIESGKTYGIMIRLSDDTIVTKTISSAAGTYTTIEISSPFSSIPQKFDPYVFGELTIMTKQVRVSGIARTSDQKCRITAYEDNANLYLTDLMAPVIVTPDYSTLESLPSVIGLSASEKMIKNYDGTLRNLIDISFTPPADNNIFKHAEIWYQKDSAVWMYAGNSFTGKFTIENAEERKTYTIAAVTVNTFGNKQQISNAPKVSLYVYGKTAKPSDITNCWAQASIGGLRLDWSAVTDVDLDKYKIRYAADVDTGAWDTAIDVTTTYATSITLPAAKSGLYFIKAIDTTGNESANAISVETDIPTILNWNVQEELIEQPLFEGEKTNMFIENEELILGSSELFDSDEMFDSDEDFDFGSGISPQGYYETDVIDLGVVQTARCSSKIIYMAVNALQIFDDDVDMFDSDEMFDGDISAICMVSQIALSQDGSTWGDWQNFFVGDYTARAFKFRLAVSSIQTYQYAKISIAEFYVDMPDRYESGSDEVVPAVGKTFTFGKSFMVKPRIGITIQAAQSGDFYELLNITSSQFDVQIKNGSNGVERTIDWEAKSY